MVSEDIQGTYNKWGPKLDSVNGNVDDNDN